MSVSYVQPVLHLLKVSLINPNDDDGKLKKPMKITLLSYFIDKYQDPVTDALLDMVSLFAPWFKSQYIDPDKESI